MKIGTLAAQMGIGHGVGEGAAAPRRCGGELATVEMVTRPAVVVRDAGGQGQTWGPFVDGIGGCEG